MGYAGCIAACSAIPTICPARETPTVAEAAPTAKTARMMMGSWGLWSLLIIKFSEMQGILRWPVSYKAKPCNMRGEWDAWGLWNCSSLQLETGMGITGTLFSLVCY